MRDTSSLAPRADNARLDANATRVDYSRSKRVARLCNRDLLNS